MPSFCIKKYSVGLKTYSIELQMMGRGKSIAAGLQILRRGHPKKYFRFNKKRQICTTTLILLFILINADNKVFLYSG
jgi:hypothetical protein